MMVFLYWIRSGGRLISGVFVDFKISCISSKFMSSKWVYQLVVGQWWVPPRWIVLLSTMWCGTCVGAETTRPSFALLRTEPVEAMGVERGGLAEVRAIRSWPVHPSQTRRSRRFRVLATPSRSTCPSLVPLFEIIGLMGCENGVKDIVASQWAPVGVEPW